MDRVSVCGLFVHNVSMDQAVAECLRLIEHGGPAAVYTPNAEMAKLALDEPEFMALLNSADLVIPDGAGVVLASKMLRRPLQEKVAGVELAEHLLPELERTGARLFLFGGKPGIAEKAAGIMLQRHPGLNICGTADGYFTEDVQRTELIRAAGAQVVYVCLGAPKQERFIHRNKESCGALMLGLGGTLDVISGEVARAPDFYIKHNLEWLYRGALDPKRWRRLLKIPAFLWDVARYKG